MKSRTQVASATLIWLGSMISSAPGQAPAPTVSSAASQRLEEVAANSRTSLTGRLNLDTLATTVGPRAVVKVDGVAAPGLRMTLDGSTSSGGKIWYRWIQTQGPKVSILAADQPSAQFIIPEEGSLLGFVLVVGNTAGIDARAVVVEVEDPERESSSLPLKADAGLDQIAIVGRRVTLDGIKSEPKGRLRYRWIQSNGPKAALHGSGGSACSFVPDVPGTYQFALLVLGADDLVSEASLVSVQAKVARPAEPGDKATDLPAGAMAIDELARASLASIAGGSKYASAMSRDFDSVADRIDSFKTYFDAASDLTRRLDAVVPRDPTHRAEWIDRFFKPWSTKVAETMQPQGVDLSQPTGQVKPLSRAQRASLATQLRYTAAGLRAGQTLR